VGLLLPFISKFHEELWNKLKKFRPFLHEREGGRGPISPASIVLHVNYSKSLSPVNHQNLLFSHFLWKTSVDNDKCIMITKNRICVSRI
jgi:hypothetical protein